MTTLPAEGGAPSPREIAASLRRIAERAARRPVTITGGEMDLLISAAALIEIAFVKVPVPAGELS